MPQTIVSSRLETNVSGSNGTTLALFSQRPMKEQIVAGHPDMRPVALIRASFAVICSEICCQSCGYRGSVPVVAGENWAARSSTRSDSHSGRNRPPRASVVNPCSADQNTSARVSTSVS